jgi:hypothetical protein
MPTLTFLYQTSLCQLCGGLTRIGSRTHACLPRLKPLVPCVVLQMPQRTLPLLTPRTPRPRRRQPKQLALAW